MKSTEIILNELAQMGDEKRIKTQMKQGISEKQFGVSIGKLRSYAKSLETSQDIAFSLWQSGYYEAMFLSTMLFDPQRLNSNSIKALVTSTSYDTLVDELSLKVLLFSPCARDLMDIWIYEEGLIGRCGWNIAIGLFINNRLDDKTIDTLITHIENHLILVDPKVQWAMNRCLCEIGIKDQNRRLRCLDIGERLGVYKDMKVSKGCTSAYAPAWIHARVKITNK